MPAACFVGSLLCVSGLLTGKFWAGLQEDASDLRSDRDWFSMLLAAVFELAATLNLWEENLVLVDRSRVPDRVFAIAFESVLKKCLQKREGCEGKSEA